MLFGVVANVSVVNILYPSETWTISKIMTCGDSVHDYQLLAAKTGVALVRVAGVAVPEEASIYYGYMRIFCAAHNYIVLRSAPRADLHYFMKDVSGGVTAMDNHLVRRVRCLMYSAWLFAPSGGIRYSAEAIGNLWASDRGVNGVFADDSTAEIVGYIPDIQYEFPHKVAFVDRSIGPFVNERLSSKRTISDALSDRIQDLVRLSTGKGYMRRPFGRFSSVPALLAAKGTAACAEAILNETRQDKTGTDPESFFPLVVGRVLFDAMRSKLFAFYPSVGKIKRDFQHVAFCLYLQNNHGILSTCSPSLVVKGLPGKAQCAISYRVNWLKGALNTDEEFAFAKEHRMNSMCIAANMRPFVDNVASLDVSITIPGGGPVKQIGVRPSCKVHDKNALNEWQWGLLHARWGAGLSSEQYADDFVCINSTSLAMAFAVLSQIQPQVLYLVDSMTVFTGYLAANRNQIRSKVNSSDALWGPTEAHIKKIRSELKSDHQSEWDKFTTASVDQFPLQMIVESRQVSLVVHSNTTGDTSTKTFAVATTIATKTYSSYLHDKELHRIYVCESTKSARFEQQKTNVLKTRLIAALKPHGLEKTLVAKWDEATTSLLYLPRLL